LINTGGREEEEWEDKLTTTNPGPAYVWHTPVLASQDFRVCLCIKKYYSDK
jgi:hypothetical protein